MALKNQLIATANSYPTFEVAFPNRKLLHDSRIKLFHAQNILTNTKRNMERIGEHGSTIASSQDHDQFLQDLDNLSRDVSNYIDTSNKLVQVAGELISMVSAWRPG
jgi:hypothetical protein